MFRRRQEVECKYLSLRQESIQMVSNTIVCVLKHRFLIRNNTILITQYMV